MKKTPRVTDKARAKSVACSILQGHTFGKEHGTGYYFNRLCKKRECLNCGQIQIAPYWSVNGLLNWGDL